MSFFSHLSLLCTNVVHFLLRGLDFWETLVYFCWCNFFFHWKESIYKKNKTNGKIEKIWAHPAMENGVFSISNIGLKFISDMSIQSLFVRHFTCSFFFFFPTKNSSSSVCFNPPAFNTLYLMQFLALFSACLLFARSYIPFIMIFSENFIIIFRGCKNQQPTIARHRQHSMLNWKTWMGRGCCCWRWWWCNFLQENAF